MDTIGGVFGFAWPLRRLIPHFTISASLVPFFYNLITFHDFHQSVILEEFMLSRVYSVYNFFPSIDQSLFI